MKTRYQTHIIDKLRKLREERNVSQAKVARELEISPGQLGNIESCKRSHKYTLKQIFTLSELFEVPMQRIFDNGGKQLGDDIKSLIQQIIKYQDDKEDQE